MTGKRHKSKSHEKNSREAFFSILKACEGPFKGKKFEIPEWKTVVIKRSESSLTPCFHRRLGEICLPDPDVSRLHAKVSLYHYLLFVLVMNLCFRYLSKVADLNSWIWEA